MGDDHIEHKMLSKGIENAQMRIENRNFDARKNLLEYDDVSNDQRQAIYSLRNQLLEEEDISQTIDELITAEFKRISNQYIPIDSVESQWRTKELQEYLLVSFGIGNDIHSMIQDNKKLLPETIADVIVSKCKNVYQDKYKSFGDSRLLLEKQVMLQVLDVHWKEHLAEIDHLRGSIGLRAYAQKNPKNEFKQEAYSMFESMLNAIDSETIRALFSIELVSKNTLDALKQKEKKEMKLEKSDSPVIDNQYKEENQSAEKAPLRQQKFGRNQIVKITNGREEVEMKYKKAQPLIESGEWRID